MSLYESIFEEIEKFLERKIPNRRGTVIEYVSIKEILKENVKNGKNIIIVPYVAGTDCLTQKCIKSTCLLCGNEILIDELYIRAINYLGYIGVKFIIIPFCLDCKNLVSGSLIAKIVEKLGIDFRSLVPDIISYLITKGIASIVYEYHCKIEGFESLCYAAEISKNEVESIVLSIINSVFGFSSQCYAGS